MAGAAMIDADSITIWGLVRWFLVALFAGAGWSVGCWLIGKVLR